MTNQSYIEHFLNRFSSFFDAVVRELQVVYRQNNQTVIVSLMLSARDVETPENDGWVDVLLRIEGVTEFRFADSQKASYQVLSDGLKILPIREGLFFDLGFFDELPSDFDELALSQHYAFGTGFTWEVRTYAD